MSDPIIAKHWHRGEDGRVVCDLCPHRCALVDGTTGRCGARRAEGGLLRSLNYGRVCVCTVDPIEKKPIFHYRPGSTVLSLGTFGCNLDCDHCQNFMLTRASDQEASGTDMRPDEIIALAKEKGARGIAFTFNEPMAWYEFVTDVAELAAQAGLFVLLNTNGFVLPGPGEELMKRVQVMNIDVKGFTEHYYRHSCGGSLTDVLRTCEAADRLGVHIEITYLLVTGLNDSDDEVRAFSRWVVERLGASTPIFFFRFAPCHRLTDTPQESMERMHRAVTIARTEGAGHVYLGGVADEEQNTRCSECGAVLVERKSIVPTDKICFKGTSISRFCPTCTKVEVHAIDGRCPWCGARAPFD
jgi:pyruvate formate lyase activating enzyme